jgi:hypothetical protein
VLIVGGLALFAVSNLSPALSVVFLGRTTIVLPLAAWVGIAIAAGAFTSFFLQLLISLQGGYSSRSFEQARNVPPRTRSFERETPTEPKPEPEPQTRYTPPSSEASTSSAASDWEEPSSDDWDFDEQPSTSKSSEEAVNRDQVRSTTQSDRTDYEVKQETKTGYQTGSVYSYSYRNQEQNQSGVGKADAVYDANYRVITPPFQKPPEKPPEPENNDEDWGMFEDDEDFDFEDEDEGKSRRR